MSLLGPGNFVGTDADHYRATTALRNSKVGCVKNATLDGVSEAFGVFCEGRVLGGAQQLGNVLDHERQWVDLFQRPQVLPPQTSSLEADRIAIEGREPLAWRPPDEGVSRLEGGNVLDRRLSNAIAEISLQVSAASGSDSTPKTERKRLLSSKPRVRPPHPAKRSITV